MLAPKIINFLYTKLLKPVLFLFKPEFMHESFGRVGHFLGKFTITRGIVTIFFRYRDKSLEQDILGFHFSNPVGLSAGFDKDVLLCHTMSDVGFGFMEVGSITRKPYDGNPKPRLYRLKKSEGLIVYYGLKNKGADYAVKKLKSYKNIRIPVIISVAKTNCAINVAMSAGREDYSETLKIIKKSGVGDMIDINISCPNAFGGEDFASQKRLSLLLQDIESLKLKQPIFVKMPIDKSWDELKILIDLCLEYGVKGVVISNLTKQRDHILEANEIQNIPGGISGKPTQEKSNMLIGEVYKYCGGRLLIIGVGGIFSAEDAYDKIKQGASLVQLITSMIFEGPQLIGSINKGLVTLMKKDGYTHISQAIGANFISK